ncbi:hypothetical protein IID21_03410 [Patescibacteria group bacterium]|nr:hypothetical protein [Patescibacteria group bacterium]
MPEDYPATLTTPPTDPITQAPSPPNQNQKKPARTVLILFLSAALVFSLAAFGYTLWQYLGLKKETKIATQLPIPTTPTQQDELETEKTETEIKRTTEDKNKYIYQIGNFELKIDRGYVYLDSVISGANRVSQSQAYPAEEAEYCLSLVGGVHRLLLERKYPSLERPVFGGNPLLTFKYWNPNKLVYLDSQAETEIKDRLENFINLFSYTDSGELLEKVVSLAGSDYSANKYLTYQGRLLNPWSGTGVGGCGGGFSYPILIKKINSQKYNKVFFAETFEGNEPSNPNMPIKKLLINKGESWLLITEQRKGEDFTKFQEQAGQITSCPQAQLGEWLRCNEQLWRENFRDENTNQQWIERILSFVTYTGTD